LSCGGVTPAAGPASRGLFLAPILCWHGRRAENTNDGRNVMTLYVLWQAANNEEIETDAAKEAETPMVRGPYKKHA
jgi:hypothetical protein